VPPTQIPARNQAVQTAEFVAPAEQGIQPLPKFKVVGNYKKTTMTLLVGPEASREDIRRLLLGLSRAAHEKNLESLGIPVTTPGGNYGPHGIVNIYILNNPKLASTHSLTRFMEADEGSGVDVTFTRAVLGKYNFSRVVNQETASLGMKSSKAASQESYESVLSNKLTDSKSEVCGTIARAVQQFVDTGLIMKYERGWRIVYVDKAWYRIPYDSKITFLKAISECYSGGILTVKDGYSGKEVGSVGPLSGYKIHE
jgi:hypothetical protein